MTIAERFWPKVERGDDCWLWTAGHYTCGYGAFWLDGRMRLAHRVAYELVVGPIPDGLEIDHLCRNKPCVNPAHLQAVTHAENVRRGGRPIGTHCKHGHSLDDDNIYLSSNGDRHCRQCALDSQRAKAGTPEHREYERLRARRRRAEGRMK